MSVRCLSPADSLHGNKWCVVPIHAHSRETRLLLYRQKMNAFINKTVVVIQNEMLLLLNSFWSLWCTNFPSLSEEPKWEGTKHGMQMQDLEKCHVNILSILTTEFWFYFAGIRFCVVLTHHVLALLSGCCQWQSWVTGPLSWLRRHCMGSSCWCCCEWYRSDL